MKLNEQISGKSLIVEERDRTKLPEGVLARIIYPICNVGQLNANNRVYERDVWEKVLKEEDFQHKMASRTLYGQGEHPAETQSDLQLTSHVIFETWIDEKNNEVMQKLDILDTPAGRIINTLLLAECQVGVSTRAEGDLEEFDLDEGGDEPKKCQRVVAETYNYVTTDFTADPSTYGVAPHKIERNVVETVTTLVKENKMNLNEKLFATKVLKSVQCKECKCGKDCKVQTLVDEMVESKLPECNLPIEGEVSPKVGVGNLLKKGDKEHWTVREVTANGISAVKIGQPGTEKNFSWEDVSTQGFVKIGEAIEKEDIIKHIASLVAQEATDKVISQELIDDVLSEVHSDIVDMILAELKLQGMSIEESKIIETADINKMYSDAGLPAPDGKGEHTKAFHKLVIEVAKGYVKSGDSPKEALSKAYPTAMKQLGKEKAVKKEHQKNETKINEKHSLEDVLLQIEDSSQAYLENHLFGEDNYIDTPGYYSREKEEWDSIIDFLKHNMKEGDFSALISWIKLNPEKVNSFMEKNESKINKDLLNNIVDQKVSEAIAVAERDVAVNESENIHLQYVMLQSKLNKTIGELNEALKVEKQDSKMFRTASKIQRSECDAVCKVLETKAKILSETKEALKDSNTQLSRLESQLSETVNSLTVLTEKHKKEIADTMNAGVVEGRQEILKDYLEEKLNTHRLQIDDNSRTLLESCQSLQDVDSLMGKLIGVARKSALHSKPLTKIEIQERTVIDPMEKNLDDTMGQLFQRMS